MTDSLEVTLTTAEGRAELARLVQLAGADLSIRAIRLLGNGSNAALEMDLSNGETIVADRFGDLWTHTGLAKFITQNTGIRPKGMTKDDAESANALIRQLATVSRETRVGDLGRDHGLAFLRDAAVEPFFLHDQSDRYRAFAALDACNVDLTRWLRDEDRQQRPAELSKVLQDRRTAVRYVHCGHLFADVHHRREVSHPGELADRMVKAGWERSGKRGRIKATSVGGLGPHIVLPLWAVSKGWDDSDEDEPEPTPEEPG